MRATCYLLHSYDKQRIDLRPEAGESELYTLYLAKNETEGVQIAVYAEDDCKVTLKLDGDAPLTASIFAMNHGHVINEKLYTDSTVCYNGEALYVKKETTLPFLVEFRADGSIDAGEYEYKAVIDIDGESRILTVKTVVWNFALPENQGFETAVGIGTWRIERLHGYFNEEIYRKYYDMLLDHRMSAYQLPYDILDPRADAYMSDPRVTSFMVPNHNKTDEELIAYYNKIRSNPVWLKKAFFYPLDEPYRVEHLENLRQFCHRLREICPDIRRTSPFYVDLQVTENSDSVDHMEEYVNCWCPKLCLWDDEMAYKKFEYTPNASFADRMASMQSRGDKMWTYVCNHPILPYANLFADTPGIVQRAMFWQIYERNIEGFLYWSSNAWDYHGVECDPWQTLFNGVPDGEGNPVYGEGVLFYPGSKIGFDGPVSSIRMKICRDGIEDIELFTMAEKLLGREFVLEKVISSVPSLTDVRVTSDGFSEVRKEIGFAVEKALNK